MVIVSSRHFQLVTAHIDYQLTGDMEVTIKPVQREAFNYYKKNTMSVELVKDDHLQKMNFRVKDKVRAFDFNWFRFLYCNVCFKR